MSEKACVQFNSPWTLPFFGEIAESFSGPCDISEYPHLKNEETICNVTVYEVWQKDPIGATVEDLIVEDDAPEEDRAVVIAEKVKEEQQREMEKEKAEERRQREQEDTEQNGNGDEEQNENEEGTMK
eukprot:Trichotokara_eunicae@DN1819_c0_g1_i1.p1